MILANSPDKITVSEDAIVELTEGYNKSYWYKFGFPKFADSIDDIRKNLI